jgi:hypothetical protein
MKLVSLALPFLAVSLTACGLTASQDQSDWQDAVIANPTTAAGCYHAAYPSTDWEQVACGTATARPFASFDAAKPPTKFTVGNGADYALVSSVVISRAAGTFIEANNVTSENDSGQDDTYSLQLNSNFMSGTQACSSAGSGCLSWTQFVYSTSETSAFMQDWLIGFGDTCPATPDGWNSDGQGDCFINSAAANVDAIPVSELASMKMGGKAEDGLNILVFAGGGDAFTTNQPDSITNLSTAWNSNEFNIIGDGGGTEATFNAGATVRVRIGVDANGPSTAAPQCIANDGTTGETNNLNLGACSAFGGEEPSIEFTESD